MSFDRVFLGADGVTAEDGICEADHAQADLNELMARRGRDVYDLAGSSKLGLRPFQAWARLALPWTLVTDDGADAWQMQKFREAGVEVEVAERGEARGKTSLLVAQSANISVDLLRKRLLRNACEAAKLLETTTTLQEAKFLTQACLSLAKIG